MYKTVSVMVFLLMMFLSGSIFAETYKCQKTNGGIVFQDKPCATAQVQKIYSSLSDTESVGSLSSVLNKFFKLVKSKETEEAKRMFLLRNQRNKSYIGLVVGPSGIGGAGIFIRYTSSDYKVMKKIKNGRFAVAAIKKFNKNKSKLFMIEKIFLLLEDNVWRILPFPLDMQENYNELTVKEISAFNLLNKKITKYAKVNSKIDYGNNKKIPDNFKCVGRRCPEGWR